MGARRTCTASASLSTPWSMSARASTPKRTSLPDMLRTVVRSTRAVGPVVRRVESLVSAWGKDTWLAAQGMHAAEREGSCS